MAHVIDLLYRFWCRLVFVNNITCCIKSFICPMHHGGMVANCTSDCHEDDLASKMTKARSTMLLEAAQFEQFKLAFKCNLGS